MEWKKGLLSGIGAGIVLLIVDSLAMFIPTTSAWYKTTFPQMTTGSGIVALFISIIIMGLVMGMVYSLVRMSIPGNGMRKGMNYGIMVWLLAGLMWPVMMMGFAPLTIGIIELVSGLVSYVIASIMLTSIYEKIS